MKSQKGITMIALTVTIIVLIILASVGTYSGSNALRDAKENTLMTEIGMIQQPILQNYTKYLMTKNDMYIVGTPVAYSDVQAIATEMGVNLKITTEYTLPDPVDKLENYYYRLTTEDLKAMGVSQVEDSYIVNYKTGEVLNETLKLTRTGKPLYVYAIEE